jgi:hypothetical protein
MGFRRVLGVLAASAVLVASAGAAGYAVHDGGPRACVSPALPSGDAIMVDVHGDAWTVGSHVSGPVRELVCTDGSWVRVSGYGA